MTSATAEAPETGLEVGIEEFRQRARAWLASVEPPEIPLDLEGRYQALLNWQRTLYEGGWMGIHWPEEFGGQGLTPLHDFVFFEELARAGAPAPNVALIGHDVVGPSIREHGTPDQQRRFLPGILSGDDIWCQGFSEPDAGSDLASLRTRAHIEGDEFVISGQKVWTTWAHKATWCALLARTDPDAPKHEGISYIAVDMGSPGISVRPIVQMTGDAEFNEVFFDEVRVPVENLIGELHAGWRIAVHTLAQERGNILLRRRVELEAALRDLLAELRVALDGEELPEGHAEELGSAYLGLRALEAQTRKGLARRAAGVTLSTWDSIDKLLLARTEQRLFGVALDLLGAGRMALADLDGLSGARWAHEYLFGRASSIYGGTAQIQANVIAERHLGMPKGA